METALFSPASLFADGDGNSTDVEENADDHRSFEERRHQFPSMELVIREFSFHQLNANLLWPGTFAFAEWLVQHRLWMEGKRILELGSGTGALAIFLYKSFKLDITTSDYDDQDIEENIAHNCQFNGITPALPHIKHSWGDDFPVQHPDWDLIIASDILLYVKQYPNLIKTLSFLLKSYKPKVGEAVPFVSESNGISHSLGISKLLILDSKGFSCNSVICASDTCPWPRPAFLMSWRRRIGKEDESLFFDGCENAGLEVQHVGSRVFCIVPREMNL